MNKQIKIIIILASILVVLVAGNIIIKKVTKFNSEKSQKESEAESLAAAIKVNDYDELSAISFGDFTFTCKVRGIMTETVNFRWTHQLLRK